MNSVGVYASSYNARVSGIYPDRRGLLVEFERPVFINGEHRTVGYARRGIAGMGGIIDHIRIGAPVSVTAEFSAPGLATVTSIKLR